MIPKRPAPTVENSIAMALYQLCEAKLTVDLLSLPNTHIRHAMDQLVAIMSGGTLNMANRDPNWGGNESYWDDLCVVIEEMKAERDADVPTAPASAELVQLLLSAYAVGRDVSYGWDTDSYDLLAITTRLAEKYGVTLPIPAPAPAQGPIHQPVKATRFVK